MEQEIPVPACYFFIFLFVSRFRFTNASRTFPIFLFFSRLLVLPFVTVAFYPSAFFISGFAIEGALD
jgi:hypothetical protein